jgi:membrane protease YdiL (CAAX protease family)
MTTKDNHRHLVRLILATGLLGMLVVVLFDWPRWNDALLTDMVQGILVRGLGGLVFAILLLRFGYQVFAKQRWDSRMWWLVLPAILVAVNNFPIVAFLDGRTSLDVPSLWIGLFLLECLMIGWFEELVFRGVVLGAWVERIQSDRRDLFLAVVGSSALFGLVHLLNLTAGAGLIPTFLQVGYSFGMGMLWAVVYLKTGNLLYPMILHALYNFTGSFFVRIGTMSGRYDPITIVVTVVLALFAAGFYLQVFLRLDVEATRRLLSGPLPDPEK